MLDNRLNAHFATLRASAVGSALKRHAGNWPLYATVTGSALAMASSASASIIYATGPVSTSTLTNVAASTTTGNGHGVVRNIQLKTVHGANAGTGFSVGVEQHLFASGMKTGSAFLKNSVNMGFLFTDAHLMVKKLGANGKISALSALAASAFEGGAPKLATSCVGSGCLAAHQGWAPGAFGFAGFEFETSGHNTDYGWIRLEYTLGSNGLADGVTVEDWAYDNTGASIQAGQISTGSSTPEPSTAAMGLLAAGAAGVAALRRRRKSASQIADTTTVQ